METAGVITIAIFMIGVTFQAGRLTTRVEHLEAAGAKFDRHMEQLHGHLMRLERLIRGEEA